MEDLEEIVRDRNGYFFLRSNREAVVLLAMRDRSSVFIVEGENIGKRIAYDINNNGLSDMNGYILKRTTRLHGRLKTSYIAVRYTRINSG